MQASMEFERKALIAFRLAGWKGQEVFGLSPELRGAFGALMSSSIAEESDPDTIMRKSGYASAGTEIFQPQKRACHAMHAKFVNLPRTTAHCKVAAT